MNPATVPSRPVRLLSMTAGLVDDLTDGLSRDRPVYIGADVVDMTDLARQLNAAGERLVDRYFTVDEQRYCEARIDRFATTLAGKEAVSKVLGTGLRRGVSWHDLEIPREPTGRPSVTLRGEAMGRAHRLGLERVALTLCHERELALAVAVGIEARGNTR